MSINDPRWGNKDPDDRPNDDRRNPEQGPPDLDDIWRDFNSRLGGMFGKRGGGNGGGNGNNVGGQPPVSSRQLGGGLALIVVAVLVLWLASGFYIVDASQRGVVMRFGKFQEVTGEGLRWRLPYPFESHEVVDTTRVRNVEVGFRSGDRATNLHESLMLTDDENIVNIQFAVQYNLNSPEAFLFTNKDPDVMVKQVAESAMREVVGKSKMDFVLYEGRETVATDVQVLIQRILDSYKINGFENSGILVNRVTLQNAQPPQQVQAAFEDAVKASQDRERLKNEGQAYFNEVVPKAEGTAARLREEAQAYSASLIARADGDASRFKQLFTEYAKAPEVTRNRLYIDAMEQVFASTTKLMVDTCGNGNLLYLPLDKLLQGGQAASGQPTAVAQTPSAPAAPVAAPQQQGRAELDLRTRDVLRSRERGER
ncbi:MAG: FtsH protease activity modulator HflK [Candidatus Dactylopiibacterium carminicum]|uniref:Protein HflK n=1 Tax=Candidatus Dactylopiibacterium carminicum TaxID=857335 RepID=A0A272EZ25_9RHOO|nr:FtsH protease activity modulator HflK [Candidatus Dactylopiibacterium carminicum]KAF7600878.1 protease modulator HflK [Candidatus Dactylopiibacterium carminicum]PAS95377.1 MAG: FtsH protease activity modulator HflK [Candidatus Dactylopiibacterium carminicum]PAS98612.1 MAG: FtsH protease activity modulator HflK [Candidatus Dactylopiibacterium carminicum]PAT00877.1 MAG: HflK protein [Candidatus Dactylopiibacterium carminicum]